MVSLRRAPNTAVAIASFFVPSAAAQGPRPSPASIALAVDSLAQRVVASGLTPGLGVAVVIDGKTILAKSYGMADASRQVSANDKTLWYIASTSKSYTGVAISLLATAGVVRFDEPIAGLLPRARWHRDVDPTRITLAQFLSHTHHVNDLAVTFSAAFTGAIPERQWPELIRFAAPTGDLDLRYSNFGYNVAAMVIDAKRPEGWRAYVENAVLRPAALTETYMRVSGIDRSRFALSHEMLADGRFASTPFLKTDVTMNSAGGHLATMHDLARWTAVQMDGGVVDGKRVFPAEAIVLSHRQIAPQTVASAKRFAEFDRDGWGAGWDIGRYRGEPMVSRFGGYASIRSHLSFLPRRRIGVVAQANGQPGGAATDIIAELAYDLEAGRADARDGAERRFQELVSQLPTRRAQIASSDSVRAARQRPLDKPLTAFVGSYVSDAFGAFVVAAGDTGLRYTWGALSGQLEVFDAAKRQFRIDVGGQGTTLSFAAGETGEMNSLSLAGATFVRTR